MKADKSEIRNPKSEMAEKEKRNPVFPSRIFRGFQSLEFVAAVVSKDWKFTASFSGFGRTLAAAVLAMAMSAPVRAEDQPVQCANLIYGGLHTSRCFSDEFLSAAQKQTTVSTERRFKSVKLDSDDLFQYPFVLITGEDDFVFGAKERERVKKYCENGGFLLASAGCSSKNFDAAFRREIKTIFGEDALKEIGMDHPVFRTVNDVKELQLHHPEPGARLMGIEKNGKLVVIYSPHGLNDTGHSEGCCCCGGNEISNSLEINVNVLVYALCH